MKYVYAKGLNMRIRQAALVHGDRRTRDCDWREVRQKAENEI